MDKQIDAIRKFCSYPDLVSWNMLSIDIKNFFIKSSKYILINNIKTANRKLAREIILNGHDCISYSVKIKRKTIFNKVHSIFNYKKR